MNRPDAGAVARGTGREKSSDLSYPLAIRRCPPSSTTLNVAVGTRRGPERRFVTSVDAGVISVASGVVSVGPRWELRVSSRPGAVLDRRRIQIVTATLPR